MLVLDLVIDLLEHELADDANSLLGRRELHWTAVHCVVEDLVRFCHY